MKKWSIQMAKPLHQLYTWAVTQVAHGTCNVENAALPSGVCAEVTAVTKSVSQGCREFSAVAIATDITDGTFCAPCGGCRQVMCEFNPDVPIYLIRHHDHMVQITNLNELLPQCFTPKRIGIKFSKQ